MTDSGCIPATNRFHWRADATMTKTIFMIILLSITGPGVASVQKTIVVGSALVECTGVALQRCYRIKEDPEGAYSLYYDRIEGFEHQHGYEHQLLVEVITVDNPPADASSIRYRLVRELGREAVQFIRISAPGGSETIDPAKPVTVKGTGRGLFEGNVVIRFEDLDGNPLVQVPTTMQQQDIGAPGTWQKSITLPSPVPQTIRLIAFSPSPKEGDAAITSIPVMLTTDTQVKPVTLEDTNWQAGGINNGRGGVVSGTSTHLSTALFANGMVSGSAGCNHFKASYEIGGVPGGKQKITLVSSTAC